MEVYLFMVIIGMIVGLGFLAVGLSIGRAFNDRDDKKQSHNDHCDHVHDCGATKLRNSDVASDHGQGSDRRFVGPIQKIANEDLAATLRTLKVTGICPSQLEREILEEAANRLEEDANEQ